MCTKLGTHNVCAYARFHTPFLCTSRSTRNWAHEHHTPHSALCSSLSYAPCSDWNKMAKQAAVSQRGHFRECEVEVLLYGVKTRKHILFGSLSSSQKKVVGGAECGSGYKCSELWGRACQSVPFPHHSEPHQNNPRSGSWRGVFSSHIFNQVTTVSWWAVKPNQNNFTHK